MASTFVNLLCKTMLLMPPEHRGQLIEDLATAPEGQLDRIWVRRIKELRSVPVN